jgi:hypothetical protein
MTPQEKADFKKSIIDEIKQVFAPISQKINNINQKVEAINERVESINERVDSISERVDSMWKYSNMESYKEFPPVMYSASPINLNDFGKKILSSYHCKTSVDSISKILISEIDKASCKSPLDVQVMAEKIIQYNFHTDAFIKVRNTLYQNPMFENQPITPKILFTIMGIYLRNLYLNKNKDLLKGLPNLSLK